jgi:hypothetical protein
MTIIDFINKSSICGMQFLVWLHDHDREFVLAVALSYIVHAWALRAEHGRFKRQKELAARLAVWSVSCLAGIHLLDYFLKLTFIVA